MSSAAMPVSPPRLRGVLHGVAAVVAVVILVPLVRSAAAGAGHRISVLVFGLALIGLYSVSSIYHLGRWSRRARQIMARIDGAMIQIFIAATATPIVFHTMDGAWRLWSLVGAWTVALVGATIAASPLEGPRWLGTLGYVAVGWLAIVPFTKIMQALPAEGNGLIVLGGVLYTIGAVIFARQRPNPVPGWFGFHEVFHVLVVAATCAHLVAIWQYVIPLGPIG